MVIPGLTHLNYIMRDLNDTHITCGCLSITTSCSSSDSSSLSSSSFRIGSWFIKLPGLQQSNSKINNIELFFRFQANILLFWKTHYLNIFYFHSQVFNCDWFKSLWIINYPYCYHLKNILVLIFLGFNFCLVEQCYLLFEKVNKRKKKQVRKANMQK